MQLVEIRVADSTHLPGALEVWRASLAAAGARPSAVRTQREQARLGASDVLLVVAEEAGEVRGFALGTWVPDGAGFVPGLLRLAELVVHPDARRAGLGSALAEGLADAGWARGARRLVARPGDDVARAFLDACGLVGVDELVAPERSGAGSRGGRADAEPAAPGRPGAERAADQLADAGASAAAGLAAAGDVVDASGLVEVSRLVDDEVRDDEVPDDEVDVFAPGPVSAAGDAVWATPPPTVGRWPGVEPDDLVGELEPPVRELVVRTSGLRLGQLLKLAGLVETGAEGKALLEAGGVEVDGEVELRRGRQLHDGAVVVARDQAVRVVLPQP